MQFDRRLIDSRRIIFVGENIDSVKRIFFIDSKLPIKFDRLDVSYADGLAKLPALVEKDLNDNNELLLKTSFEKNDFRHSLFDIKDIKSSHDMIVSFCKDLNKIDRNLGSEKQWNELFTLLQDNGFEWLRLVNDMIGSEKTLANTMMLFHSFSDFKQWLYFIALKYFGANENNYLTHVVYKSNNLEQFITELYDSILRLDYDESNFIDQYKERKFLLSHFPDNSNALISYSKKVTSKGLNAVYYLTDLTKLERELIIKYIGDFALENERPKVEELLQIL